MNSLVYKLKLLKTIRIYNVISIVYLEQAILDFYNRVILSFFSLVIKKKNFYVVKKII